ncbi:MAG: tetratricopeptide repeat protein [Bryobacteraceae bacterium]
MRCRASMIAVLGCLLLSLVYCGLSATQIQPSKDAYTRGKTALDRKSYTEAAKALLQAEAQAPGTTNALALRAKALIHLDQYEEAEHCLRDYLKLHPRSPDAIFLLGYVLFRRNQPRESLAVYTGAAALQRPAAEDFKIVGLDYVLLSDYPDAVRWLERSVAEGPNDAEAFYYLGRAYYVQNFFDKAIAAFEQALRLDPQHAKAQNNLGLALAGRNQPDAAEAAYRKAIQIGHERGKPSEQPYINLAELLSHSNHESEALRLLETAEQIAGKSDRSEEVRGRILLAQNRLGEAETAFRNAIARRPSNGALHYLLGRVLKREGKSDDAEKEFAQTKTLLGTHSSLPD